MKTVHVFRAHKGTKQLVDKYIKENNINMTFSKFVCSLIDEKLTKKKKQIK